MKRLILTGQMGVGKSTLIRHSLGNDSLRAGGFITRRVFENGLLQGYAIAPAASLTDNSIQGQTFLSLTPKPCRHDHVFSQLGTQLLRSAQQASFAVADEFGGLELLVPSFYEQLFTLFRSDVPVIGVMKTPKAARALSEKISLRDDYAQKVQALYAMLKHDPETTFLPVSCLGDPQAVPVIEHWINTYVRR